MSVHNLPNNIKVKEVGVANYLILCPLKIIKIVIYNADIIKGRY